VRRLGHERRAALRQGNRHYLVPPAMMIWIEAEER
jgi:hypothetical protein